MWQNGFFCCKSIKVFLLVKDVSVMVKVWAQCLHFARVNRISQTQLHQAHESHKMHNSEPEADESRVGANQHTAHKHGSWKACALHTLLRTNSKHSFSFLPTHIHTEESGVCKYHVGKHGTHSQPPAAVWNWALTRTNMSYFQESSLTPGERSVYPEQGCVFTLMCTGSEPRQHTQQWSSALRP